MKEKPEIINIEEEKLKELIEKVQKSLSDEDAKIIIGMIDTLKFICEKLENKDVQIKRLLKRLFGIKSEKTKDIIKKIGDSEKDSSENENKSTPDTPNDSEEELLENASGPSCNIQDTTNSNASDETQKQEEEEKKSDPKKGHGRNGIDKYPGANVIPVDHESLKSGDPCPKCPTGKVYQQKPGIFVFIKGNTPVDATIYKREKFRCNLCGAIFEAKLPDHLPQETKARKYYDETSKTIMIMLALWLWLWVSFAPNGKTSGEYRHSFACIHTMG